MTLIEMLMAIFIFTMGIAGFTLLFSRTWKTNSFVLEEGQSAAEVSRAINIITEDLRKIKPADNGSYAIKTGNDFDLVVYLDEDNDGVTERVHFYLDAGSGNLNKGITKPSGSPLAYPAGDASTITLAHYIVNTSAQPIFYYYGNDYAGGTGSPLATPIVPVDARLVQLYLWVNIKPLTAPDNVNMQTFIELRNLNEN